MTGNAIEMKSYRLSRAAVRRAEREQTGVMEKLAELDERLALRADQVAAARSSPQRR